MFLENYVLFEDSKMNRIFKERIKSQDKNDVMSLEEYVKQMGKEEGLAEGMKKGIAEGIKEGEENRNRLWMETLLLDGSLSVDKIASLGGVTVEFVVKLKNELKIK